MSMMSHLRLTGQNDYVVDLASKLLIHKLINNGFSNIPSPRNCESSVSGHGDNSGANEELG